MITNIPKDDQYFCSVGTQKKNLFIWDLNRAINKNDEQDDD